MKIDMNAYNNAAEATSFRDPVCGAYRCIIKKVEDKEQNGKPYLEVEYDFADGEFKDYATDLCEKFGFWALHTRLYYSEKAMGIFKRNMKCIESANGGFTFNGNENALVGKCFYALVQTEEYVKQNGKTGTRYNVTDFLTADDFKNGDYKIPDPIKLTDKAPTSAPAFTVLNDDGGNLPF